MCMDIKKSTYIKMQQLQTFLSFKSLINGKGFLCYSTFYDSHTRRHFGIKVSNDPNLTNL